MKPPSFEPWLARVRMARMWAAILGCVVVSTASYKGGAAWDDAMIRGLIATAVCYFLGWAAALWICGELYSAQISKLRGDMEKRARDRSSELQELYESQVLAQQGIDFGGSADADTNITPLQPPGSAPPASDRRAA